LVETIAEVENEGLKVSDIVVVLDREQGGKQLLQEKGYNVHTLFSISEVVEILKEVDHLTDEEVERINDFINGNKIQFKEEKDFLTNKNY
jgi:uridine monophosphate synthetase